MITIDIKEESVNVIFTSYYMFCGMNRINTDYYYFKKSYKDGSKKWMTYINNPLTILRKENHKKFKGINEMYQRYVSSIGINSELIKPMNYDDKQKFLKKIIKEHNEHVYNYHPTVYYKVYIDWRNNIVIEPYKYTDAYVRNLKLENILYEND
jgi:hypothetical protein